MRDGLYVTENPDDEEMSPKSLISTLSLSSTFFSIWVTSTFLSSSLGFDVPAHGSIWLSLLPHFAPRFLSEPGGGPPDHGSYAILSGSALPSFLVSSSFGFAFALP